MSDEGWKSTPSRDEPIYEAVREVIRSSRRDAGTNAFAWRCVYAALDALGAAGYRRDVASPGQDGRP